MKWLIQPVKVEKEKMEELMDMLEKADIPFDIVYPIKGEILTPEKTPYIFNDKETYFVCGSYPLTRYVHKIRPEAVFSLENYSFDNLMEIFGKENFVNYDAKVLDSKDLIWNEEEYFIRPLNDDKAFNGGIYNSNTFQYEGDIVVAKLKSISQEHRFFVINGEIITGSRYKVAGSFSSSPIIDDGALSFAKKMIEKFKEPGFVIDIATINNEYKIMELNCFNASGFYDINLYKYIVAVENYYHEVVVKNHF